jgi:hypothetical protein
MNSGYFCVDKKRKELIYNKGKNGDQSPLINGIDYLEVGSDHRTLILNFILPFPKNSERINPNNISIEGESGSVILMY